jgi:hypothetical protein
MKKPTPEERRRFLEEGEAGRRELQATLDRVGARIEARRSARIERENRRRRLLRRLLPFRRA